MFFQFRTSFRNNFIAGVLVLAPLGVVFWMLVSVWNIIKDLSELLPTPRTFFDFENSFLLFLVDALSTILTFCGVLVFICIVGLVSRNYFGSSLLKAISSFFSRIPVLSAVYTTLEKLMKTFASGNSKNFRRVVYIEYPRKGIYTLALVTGERHSHPLTPEHKQNFTNVFVPTTPNPTSGFYLSLPSSEVREVDMTVEEALKEIISMGIVHKDVTDR